jgi:hypothetical protein
MQIWPSFLGQAYGHFSFPLLGFADQSNPDALKRVWRRDASVRKITEINSGYQTGQNALVDMHGYVDHFNSLRFYANLALISQ